MARVRAGNTQPERVLRSALWKEGLRYRVLQRVEGTRPDVVFGGRRVAVFVDGCFWHGCPSHYGAPKTRQEFWSEKLRSNVERDRRQTRLLLERGWRPVRVWEHELEEDLGSVVRRVRDALEAPEGRWWVEPGWRLIRLGPDGPEQVALV